MVIRRIQFAVLVLFAVIILLFTFFGETLYYTTKPYVKITTPTSYTIDGEWLIIIPRTAYLDGVVYLIEYETSLSKTLTRVRAVNVEVTDCNYYESNLVVISGLESGEMIVRSTDRALRDGDFVVISD
jgi:hypothetical protein